LRIRALDLDGKPIDQAGEGFVTRVWQHEFDHLNGKMLTDRMGPVSKIAHRKALKELEEKYEAANPKPAPPPVRRRRKV
jgi:peptide deformylase